MKVTALSSDPWQQSLMLWFPPVLAVGGFLLGLTFYGPGATLLVWGISWCLAYLILVREFQQTRRTYDAQYRVPRRIPGLRLAPVSAVLLSSGFALFSLLVFTPSGICQGGRSCPPQPIGPWPLNLFTGLQLLELAFLLTVAGIASLAVASRLLARAQRRFRSPRVAGSVPNTPARTL